MSGCHSQAPLSCRLLRGYESLLSAKKVILGNYAFLDRIGKSN